MSKEQPFSIVKAELPKKSFPKKSIVYDQLIEKLKECPKGASYKIAMVGKRDATVYQALSSRLKESKTMKLHKFSTGIFVEVLAEPKAEKKKGSFG
jgi:hypothetical protein